MTNSIQAKEVAIVYNYIAHYRVPIFNLLSSDEKNNYTIFSGTTSEIQIKLASENLSKKKNSEGGINWIQIKNYWLFNLFLIQPFSILLPLKRKYNTIIYLGNMYYLTTWISAILARLCGKKIIFWTHGFIKEENNIKGLIRATFYKLSNEILVYGQRSKNILVSKKFNPDKIKLIYNSLDYSLHQNIINTLRTESFKFDFFKDNNLPLIGFIGRLTPQKKIHILLEVLEKMKDSNNFNILIIGDGSEREKLLELITKLNIEDNICLYGSCYNEQEISQLITCIDVLISPGEVGLSAVHSMTFGTPVLTHNRFDLQMPEFEAISPGLTGDFFDYSNPVDSLCQILPKWLNKSDKRIDDCKKVISDKFNPQVQLSIFNNIV